MKEEELKDMLGQSMKIGDFVVYTPPYSKIMEIGRITRLTPKNVYVKGIESDCEDLRYPMACMKVTQQMKEVMNLFPERYI